MRRQWGKRSLVVVLVCLAWSSVSSAQTADETLRRDLLEQAEQARDAGDHALSVDLATRASLLRMTPSLGLMIAQEHEQLGHVVEAIDHARRCASDASSDASLRNRERIARNCRDLASSLAPQVARVTVHVPADAASAAVVVGGRSIPPAGWEVPIAVDPGEVVVRASASDGRRFERTVHLARGASAEVRVSLETPALPAAAAPTMVRDARSESLPRATDVPHVPRPGAGPGPWVVTGIGAAGFVLAGVLWSLHIDAIAERDGLCDESGCDPLAQDANSRAQDMTTGTNLTIGLGSAAIAGGLTWFFLARSSTRERSGGQPAAWLMPSRTGLILGGTL